MDAAERELLDGLVKRVLRHPDEAKDIDAERALQRLLAARSDAPYLLLQRSLVLEVALAHVRSEVDRLRAAEGRAANDPQLPAAVPGAGGASAGAAVAALPARGFLRDAAVISAGVLGGSLLVRGAESLFEGESAADADLDLDLDLDGWI
ncbi:MAG: DUF2076 family protein [bacterium]|nr:DUF2076 family protein [Betaproteobacteria bacterium]